MDKRNSVSIEAPRALKAGEIALGQPLSSDGKTAKAIVWRLTAGYVRATLYEPEASIG